MNRRRVVRIVALVAGAVVLASPFLLRNAAPPVLLNLTESLPGRVFVRVGGEPRVGDVVAVCLPEELARFAVEREYVARGRRCPGGASPLLKHVAALAGAAVRYERNGLLIDGETFLESASLQQDTQGRPMPVLRTPPYRVGAGEVLLLNPHPRSFDSRYFGPVSVASVLGVYRAVSESTPPLSSRATRGTWAGGRIATPPPSQIPRCARDDKGGEARCDHGKDSL